MVSEDVKAYVSSLADLTFNSKPLINMLTMLADENVAHAPEIVDVVEDHLAKVKTDVKLPVLYLIDCIVKNVGGPYNELFSRNIVATFCNVFRVVDEKTRAEMFKLRQTWNEIFSPKKLYAIDVQIRVLDPAWPVTAPVPKNCIHLNPKFLKNTAGAATSPKTAVMSSVPASNADPATLDMQQQLIQKQKELIELQQKKLELELLQTKVRLREQISANTISGTPASLPQNVLLKPEVAKQLLPPNALRTVIENKNTQLTMPSKIPTLDISKTSVNTMSAAKGQRMQFQAANNGPKIQPANSALVAAAINRPIRDPRLLRQQQNQLQTLNTANTNVQIEIKNNSDSSNKIVNSKTSVRDIQNDPRLKNINDNAPTQKFTDTNKPKSKISPKSRSERNQSRTSRFKNVDDSKSSKSSSSSSLDSPKKSKTEKSSPTKSPSSRSVSRKEGSSPKSKLFKSSREPKISKSDTSLPVFKDVKNSKNRNYMRRNRSPQFSPEMTAQDIDLRLNGPPEKQPRLSPQTEKNASPIILEEPTSPPAIAMDVDLRQLPAVIGKKRLSLDEEELIPNKKSRTEIFDELFGNEDVDLRKLPVPTPDRPPTPPPPIISSSEIHQESESPVPKPDLQTVRAKLAANLKKSNSPIYKKKSEDEDLRLSQVSSSTDISNKIIISKADGDKIKEGGMNSIQQKQLMNKIIAQIEAQKLKEAKQKNNEENVGNISLTPISDDELDTDFNEENKNRRESPLPPASFGDKDERMLLPQPMVHPPDDHFNRFGRDLRRGGPAWRGIRGRRHWEGPYQRPPLRPWMPQPPMNAWGPGMYRPPFPEMDQNERRSPDGVHDIIIESASQEDIKTITIDGLPRDIRYYDEVAVIFMNWDDPREISFQDGTRRVSFNDIDMYMMNFNEPYREYKIGDCLHKVRLGGPSREIYINYKPYECYFGGPGITIDLDGKVTTVKLDGPPPQVKISDTQTNLVAGKIKLIIDAKTIIPIFLDAKVQTFNYNGEQHTVQFLPGLKSALINNENFEVQFGGLPKPVMLKDKRHYIRFSVLPKALKQGRIRIKGLESDDVTSSPQLDDMLDANEPALPIPQRVIKAYDPNISPDNSSSSNLFQNVLQQQNLQNLDFLTNVISTTEQPSNTYQVETSNQPAQQTENAVNPSNLFNMSNINDLFQKLVASGIVTTSASAPVRETPPVQNTNRERPKHGFKQSKKHPPLKPVSFDKPEQLKIRQGALYEKLYIGMQCSSCGMRFPPEQSLYYSQHLDWHFRQNRRGKKNARVAASRKWYYTLSDWSKYEEIEDLDEREKNFFDQQQQQAESAADEAVEEAEMPSVTADPELQDICDVCGDKFEIFFHEDKEEWHLKNSVRDGDKIYHPICFEEYQQSLLNASLVQSDTEEKQGSNEASQIPGIEIVLDDDEEMEKTEEVVDEVILDESDESKLTTTDEKKEEPPLEYEDEDDDVIIKEETIEQIILDDDDDKMDEEEISEPSPLASSRESSPKPKESAEVIDDGFVDVNEGLLMLQNGGPIKVKSEPIDDGYLVEENAFENSLEEEEVNKSTDMEEVDEPKEPEAEQAQSQAGFIASIDGNLEMDISAPTPVSNVCGKIKINIHKPLPVLPPKNNNKDISLENLPESVIDPSQPLPPGEEPILLKLKPALQGVELKKMPVVQKGSELSGMCTIM